MPRTSAWNYCLTRVMLVITFACALPNGSLTLNLLSSDIIFYCTPNNLINHHQDTKLSQPIISLALSHFVRSAHSSQDGSPRWLYRAYLADSNARQPLKYALPYEGIYMGGVPQGFEIIIRQYYNEFLFLLYSARQIESLPSGTDPTLASTTSTTSSMPPSQSLPPNTPANCPPSTGESSRSTQERQQEILIIVLPAALATIVVVLIIAFISILTCVCVTRRSPSKE